VEKCGRIHFAGKVLGRSHALPAASARGADHFDAVDISLREKEGERVEVDGVSVGL
jgi:hypothetical protein